jgi:hypothetical protein
MILYLFINGLAEGCHSIITQQERGSALFDELVTFSVTRLVLLVGMWQTLWCRYCVNRPI